MKRDTWIKISLIAVMGIALGCYGVYLYGYAVVDFNRQARLAFEKALERELANRKANEGPLKIVSQVGVSETGEIPQTVWMDKGSGRVEYKISPEKHQRNIVEDVNVRILHSMVFEKNPIIPDTLNAIWQQTLSEQHLAVRTALRIAVADGRGHTIVLETADYIRLNSDFPLVRCYLGYGSEIELTAFINYSWWYALARYAGIRLLSLLGGCVLFYLFVDYLIKIFHRLPVTVVKETVVARFVKVLPEGEERVFQLRENLIFNADRKLLIVGEEERVLNLQICDFFELLLNAEGHELSDTAIMERLWSDGSGTAVRLSQVVSRLRASLKVDPPIKIERTSAPGYKLLI